MNKVNNKEDIKYWFDDWCHDMILRQRKRKAFLLLLPLKLIKRFCHLLWSGAMPAGSPFHCYPASLLSPSICFRITRRFLDHFNFCHHYCTPIKQFINAVFCLEVSHPTVLIPSCFGATVWSFAWSCLFQLRSTPALLSGGLDWCDPSSTPLVAGGGGREARSYLSHST